MSKKDKIIIISAGGLVLVGVLAILFNNGKKEKYNRTVVTPDYAKGLIKSS